MPGRSNGETIPHSSEAETPPAASAPIRLQTLIRPGHNLPLPLTSFIGRESQIAEVKRLLRPPSAIEGPGGGQGRLLTLVGLGGCGKTRLAIEAARGLVEEFADGVWWIELVALSDPALVPQTVAFTLGIREQTGSPLVETLSDAFRSRQLLLVLDNCEHLLAACGRLAATLLQTCPLLYILVTSRAALNVAGEIAWPVPPLASPDPQHLSPSDIDPISHLHQYESVRLFVERAGLVLPGFTLSDQNFAAIAQICHCLDGIPLAIELAAARVKVLTAQQIASRLDHLFRLLTRGGETALPRHQTLRATVDWSYALLTEKDRILLRRLSVFAGSFSLTAAEAVCAGEGLAEAEILDALSDLVDQSLVLVSEREPLEEARYRQLEMIRQYGQEKLEEAGEAERVRERQLDFFQRLAEEAEPKLRGAEQVGWLRRLEVEYDNLREALNWSDIARNLANSARPRSGDPGLRLASSLWMFWEFKGFFTEGRTWLEWMLDKSSDTPSSEKAEALTGAGTIAWHQGDLTQAIAYHEAALATYREIGDSAGIAFALNNVATQYLDQALYDRADALFEESLTRYRDLRDSWGIGLVLNNLGSTARNRGDSFRAAGLYREGLTHLRQAADKRLLAILLLNMGELAQDQADHEEAIARYEESLSLFLEFGERTYMTDWILRMLGDLALVQGNVEHATQIFLERLQLCWELGDKNNLTESLERLARVLELKGQLHAAVHLFGAADALRKAIDVPLPPAVLPTHERMVAELRESLGEKAFKDAWTFGQAMAGEGWEKVVSYALLQPSLSEPAPRSEPETGPARLLLPREADKQKYGGLTPKEREVAALVAQGKSNQEIAAELFVGLKAVEAHVTRILSKLGFTSRAQIAAWAVAKGLAEAPTDLDTLASGR